MITATGSETQSEIAFEDSYGVVSPPVTVTFNVRAGRTGTSRRCGVPV